VTDCMDIAIPSNVFGDAAQACCLWTSLLRQD
jgi:hypothetical protein